MLRHKRVFVTGAGGFIGSHLVRQLLWEGAQVGILVRNREACWRLADVMHEVDVIEAILEESDVWRKYLLNFRPDIVVHLAAVTDRDRSWSALQHLFRVHVDGTRDIISFLMEAGAIERFVHVGTIEEYGRSRAPFSENDRGKPITAYSLTKLLATELVEYAAREHGFPAVIVRPSLTYGPAQGAGMFVSDCIRACLRGEEFSMTPGEQTRDFLYVDDAIFGILKAAELRGAVGEIVNLGSGTEIKLRDAAERIRRACGDTGRLAVGVLPYREEEQMHFWLNSSKAASMFGWRPMVDIDEGIRRTVEWHRTHSS